MAENKWTRGIGVLYRWTDSSVVQTNCGKQEYLLNITQAKTSQTGNKLHKKMDDCSINRAVRQRYLNWFKKQSVITLSSSFNCWKENKDVQKRVQ